MSRIIESDEAFWTPEQRRFVNLVDQYPAKYSLAVVLGRIAFLAFLAGFVGFICMVGW